MTRLIISLVLFHVCWFGCVLSAANGIPLAGPAIVLASVVGQFAVGWLRGSDLYFLAIVGVAGSCIDSVAMNLGLFTFDPVSGLFVPLWMAALWINFAALAPRVLGFLEKKWVLAAGLGAISGPLCYFGAGRLGAIGFSSPWIYPLTWLALEWAVALPAALALNARIGKNNLLAEQGADS